MKAPFTFRCKKIVRAHVCAHNPIPHLCECCHEPTLQPPIFPPALLRFLCSQAARQHVQVLPPGSSAWQEACFQSSAFLPLPSSSLSFQAFFRLYRYWLITGTFFCQQCTAAAVEHLLTSHLLHLLPAHFLISGREERGEVEGRAWVQMCINEAVKGRG